VKKIWIVIGLWCLWQMPCYGAQEIANTVEIETFLQELEREYQEYIPTLDLTQFFEGEETLTAKDFLTVLSSTIKKEFMLNFHLLSNLLILAVISAVISNLEYSYAGSINQAAKLVIYFMMVMLVVASAKAVMSMGYETIERLGDFMELVLPIQLVLLVALGASSTAAFMSPTVYLMLNVLDKILEVIVYPLIYLVLALSVINHLSPRYKLLRLADLLKKITLGILGAVGSIFVALLGIEGLSGIATDGIVIRGVKYAISTLPIVGNVLESTMETIAGGSLLVKNFFGIAGLIILLLVLLLPLVKILAIAFMYKLAAALVEPLGEESTGQLLNDVANGFFLVLAVVILVSMLFFFSLIIIITAADFTVMLR